MTIALAPGETLAASGPTTVRYSLFGDQITATTDAFKTLAQGSLSVAAATIYPSTAVQTIVKTIVMFNSAGTPSTVALYANGTTSAFQIWAAVIPAGGTATYGQDGWRITDATGTTLVTAAAITATGDVSGTQSGSNLPLVLATVTTAQTVGDASHVAAVTTDVKGRVTGMTSTAIVIPEASVTGLTSDLSALSAAISGKQPTGNYLTALSGDVVASGPGSGAALIQPSAVSLSKLANATANSILGEYTGTAVAPQYQAVAANQFLARSSAGNLAAKAVTDAGLAWLALSNVAAETAALNAATVALQGMQSAVDKQKLDNVWLDVTTDFAANNLIKTTGTDQTTKINNIITAAPAGAVLYWPTGTYDTQGGHSWGKLLLMKGQTRSGSVINCTHATNTLFTMTAGADGSGFQTIRLSANTAVLRTAGYAIDYGAIPNAFIQQTDILFHWGGVRSAGPLQFMDDANIREMGANALNGNSILITGNGDRYIRRVTMDQAPRTVDFSGIRVNQCSSLVITDSNIIHCGTALHLNANAGIGTAIASVYSANTFYDTSVIGANITCATGSDTVQRATFVRCWFSTMTTAGVQINHSNVNSVDFIGCEFYQEGFGIDVTACTEWSVRSSRFAGCTTNAIRTAAGATHSFTISDNFIGNGAGFGANAQGINIQAGTYARYQIIDNRGLDTNTTPGIIDLGVVPAANQKNVSNNMGAVLKGALQLSTISAGAVTPGRGVATVGTAETYMFGARIPANGVSAGQTFKITVVAQATAACNVNFATKAGAAATLADTSVDTHVATAVALNGYVTYECLATVVALGASGNVAGVGWQLHVGSTVGKVAAVEAIATAPTTAPWFLSVTALSSVAAAITIRAVTIEAL